MARNARLIGPEGRTIVNMSVQDGTRVIRMPSFDGDINKSDPDHWVTYFNEIVYRLDFEADDGTLIFRRETPLWRENEGH